MSLSVLFVCICVLYYCHRVATQLQLNISNHSSWRSRPSKTRPLGCLETSVALRHIQESRPKVYCYEFPKTNTEDSDPLSGRWKKCTGGSEGVRNWKTVFRNKNTERQKEKEVLGIGL